MKRRMIASFLIICLVFSFLSSKFTAKSDQDLSLNQNEYAYINRDHLLSTGEIVDYIPKKATEDYRAWTQTDSRWGSIKMGSSGITIAKEGCLVTSVTKLIIQAGLRDQNSFTVATLANWLNKNSGYAGNGNALYWAKPGGCVSGFSNYGDLLEYSSYSSSSYNSQIISWIKSGKHMVIQVNNGGHWVAVDEAKTLSTGQVYIMDSISGQQNADITLVSKYLTFNSIHAFTGGSTPPTTPTYYLDVNWFLNGETSDNSAKFATCDVYVYKNGSWSQEANDVTDYYVKWEPGTPYEIKDIKTASGYYYNGVERGSLLKGTVGNDITSIWLSIVTAQKVSLRLNGGSWPSGVSDPSGQYKPGSKITLPTPVRSGYEFVGWNIDYSGSGHVLEPWGTPLHTDPVFSSTMSDIAVYNNLENGNVTINKVNKTSDCPTNSSYMLKVTTTGRANPQLGGFYQLTNSKASGVFYHVVIAKIPIGYTIERASNATGDDATHVWLTPQEGTGQFETYIYKTTCGSTGSFKTFGHVYLSGKEASASAPVTWYVGYSEVFDATGVSASGKTYTVGNGVGIIYAMWREVKYKVDVRLGGGSWPSGVSNPSGQYKAGSKITLPTPVREGYEFVGWDIDYSGTGHVLEPWGTPLHLDPTFCSTLGNISVYNNLDNGNVSIETVSRSSDCPTYSHYMLKVTTTGRANPLLGGFYQLTNSKASGVYYHMIIAKIPVGYKIERASNAMGEGATHTWLTPQEGTGSFETYIYKSTCGSTGSFKTFGHVYLSGEEASASAPVTWYVGYSEVFDATGVSASGKTYTVGNGTGILNAMWREVKYKVELRLGGGSLPDGIKDPSGEYKMGSKITLPTPEREGYEFIGWKIDYSGSSHVLEPWGTPLHLDPMFCNSLSDTRIYNNADNTNVTVERIDKTSDCPTSSHYMLKVSTSGSARPGLGGFVQSTDAKASGVFYHIIVAKIPKGYQIERGTNKLGDGGSQTWLTSQEGTGEFETYIYKTICGTTGTFQNFGYVYLQGTAATSDNPVTWYVGYSEVFDGTGISPSGKTYTVGNGVGYLSAMWKKQNPCANGHAFDYTLTTEPSVSAAGALTGTCAHCGETTTVELPKLNKTDYTYDVVREATCTKDGLASYIWKTTDYGTLSFDEILPKTGHSYKTEVIAPACTSGGYTDHVCSVCGNSYRDNFTSELGHSYGDWTQSKVPTCTGSGSETRTCARCGNVESRSVAALGHAWNDGVTIKEPTETEPGQKQLTCTRCGETLLQTIPALNHEHSYNSEVTEPTCTEDGYTTYICECGDSFTANVIPALGHDYAEKVTAPTCAEPGFTTHTCSRCGDIYVDAHTAALGHIWDEGTVTVAPTETESGVRTFTCSRCSETRSETIPALNHRHSYSPVMTAPTCTEAGFTTYTCECGESYVDDEVPALGHDFADGVCTRCGEKDTTPEPFRFDDVRDESKFYFDPVYWAFNAKPQITNGLTATTFGPDAGCTRGQVVTFLWRAAGCPEPDSTETGFTDLKDGGFYVKAVAWAVENGITNGMSPTSFAPDATCTRGQIVTFLWRFRGEPAPDSEDTGFTDVDGGAFYAKAVAWAVENKVTNGMTATTFAPNATCTRGQIVTFLYRAMER